MNEQFEDELMHRFGFCGCGQPWKVVKFIQDGLQHILNLQLDVWEDKKTYKQWELEGESIFADNGGDYFFYYWADKEGLTEHGGSVPGWLNDNGAKLLEELDTYFKDFEDETS